MGWIKQAEKFCITGGSDPIRSALWLVGAHLVGAAMLNAHESVKTGRLRGSLTWSTQKDKDEVKPDLSGTKHPEDHVSRPRDKYTCYVGTNVEYAQHVEYGTRISRAKPYLRPAINENRKECREIFSKYLKGFFRGK